MSENYNNGWTECCCRILSEQNITAYNCLDENCSVPWTKIIMSGQKIRGLGDKIWQEGTKYCNQIWSMRTRYGCHILSGQNMAAISCPHGPPNLWHGRSGNKIIIVAM